MGKSSGNRGAQTGKARHGSQARERVADNSREAAFGKHVVIMANGCWAFNGNLDRYGTFRSYRGGPASSISAHRFAYETLVGPVDEGLHLHHACFHPGCCNPAHLVPLTPLEHKAAHREAS